MRTVGLCLQTQRAEQKAKSGGPGARHGRENAALREAAYGNMLRSQSALRETRNR